MTDARMTIECPMNPSTSSRSNDPSASISPFAFSGHWAVVILWSLAIGYWSLLPAYAVAPRLTNILPPGGQRGTEVEVRFTGQRLDDTKEVVFYTPGISVVSLEAGTNRLKATLKIAADCRLGEHSMRLRTATGVSEVRTFWVSALTNLAEAEPNTEVGKAQPVP